jgi:signal transduction histidine kinase/ligand-binding sensor domain-containing protein
MRSKHALLAYCLVLLTGALAAQDYRILHWGIENGLSQGINQKIIRDHEGFLWATSFEGVNRFDGKTFRHFYSFPRKRSAIRGIETTGLVEDSLHKIWIGSGDGLNRYDPVADSVMYFFAADQPSSRAQYIIPVAATGDEVICFDFMGRITGYNNATLSRRIIASNIKWYDDYSNVNNSWLDKKNNVLWMPVQWGIVRVDINTGHTGYFLASYQVNAITTGDTLGHLILGIDIGLLEWDPVSGHSTFHNELNASAFGKVTCLARDNAQKLWIGTEENGLFIYDRNFGDRLVSKNGAPNTISGNKINAIYCDKGGTVWISVATNGIDQLIPGNRFMHYAENMQYTSSLNANVVRCFIEDRHKNIWIGTQGGGINIFNTSTQQFSSLSKKNVSGLPFDFIRYMVTDQNNTAWIGTEKGMCRMDMNSFKTGKIYFTGQSNKMLSDCYIEQIIPFEDNDWLIATKEYGLFTLGKKADTAKQLSFPGNKHVFYTAFINNLLFTSIWDDDPKIFEISNHQWKELKKDITAFLITYVVYDATRKKYWIGTLKGLLETDENLRIIRHYTSDDGLANHYIYAMVLDDEGMLWISTNRGLSQFNTVTRRFRTFSPSDGLQGYEYNAKAGFKSGDGTIYFGGTNGFDIIKKTDHFAQDEPARFYIKEVMVNNLPHHAGENINYVKSLQLPYTGNNITIQTGIIDVTGNGNNKIRFRLEGSDTSWKTADRDFIINYSGLLPGDYRFMATASGVNNEWNNQTFLLSIHIAAPWWQTWWFRTSLAVLVAGIVLLVLRSYYHRKLQRQKTLFEKQQAVEHERTRIATDMHDDLGAGLSRIKFLSETIGIKQQQHEPIAEEISRIRTYSHEMIDKMGEIVWALNEKNDSLSDLLVYTRSYAVEYLMQHGIRCTVEIPDQFPSLFVSGEFRRNVYLVVKEALHNVVKHAHAKVVIIEMKTDSVLFISIHDDGTGFDEMHTRPYSNGLNNMKKRIAGIGGKLEIQRENGTTVILSAPLPGSALV